MDKYKLKKVLLSFLKKILASKKIVNINDLLLLFASHKALFKESYFYIATLNKIFISLLKKNNHELLFKSLSTYHFSFIIFLLKKGNLKSFKLIKKLLPLLANNNNEEDQSFHKKKRIIRVYLLKLKKKIILFKRKDKNKKIYPPHSIIDSWFN